MLLGEDEVGSVHSRWAGIWGAQGQGGTKSRGASVSKGPEPDLKEPVGLRRAAAGDGTQKVAQARFACQAGD